MNHIEQWELEREWERGERLWDRYINDIKRAMKIRNEDGDEADDGYSLDSMHKAFQHGISVADYVRGARAS